MAVTKVDIASRALIMIGANPIASFTDGTTEALTTNTIYEEIVESTLVRSNWRFATGFFSSICSSRLATGFFFRRNR